MPRLSLASLLVASALISGCGEPSDPASAAPAPVAADFAKEGAAGARAVVEAYLAAAKVRDEAAMLALGTEEWRTKEKAWQKGFTVNIVRKGYALQSATVREPEVEGETASVSVAAVFRDQGKDDREEMRFSLARRDGRWWITDLR